MTRSQSGTGVGWSRPAEHAPHHRDRAAGRAPVRLVLPAVLAVALLVAPLAALLVSTDWRDVGHQLSSPVLRDAMWLSVMTATVATTICLLLGLPLAWCLARCTFRGRALVRGLVTVPLVLPPVVGGVALMSAFGRSGFIGEPLRELTGFTFPFTTAGVVLAHTFVSMPFVVLSIEGALRTADPRLDAVAATLGADRWRIFRTITLPLALPGIAAGAVLGWARSMGEFGATITFAGNYPGTTQTMPTLINQAMNSNPEVARTLSVLLLLMAVVVLLVLRERWWVTP